MENNPRDDLTAGEGRVLDLVVLGRIQSGSKALKQHNWISCM
jgi:hypothetical protein